MAKDRVILHVDANSYYASVELLHRPDLRGKPVAVAGDPDLRHGIILAKSGEAKAYGIKTGQAIHEARAKCPDLIVLKPHYDLYIRFARLARALYQEYTDQVEPFGIDEAWLDVTGSTHLFGDGQRIADEIRDRMRTEIGLPVSVGVSFNKVFAKLGSDLKSPDATTVIPRERFREIISPLSINSIIYIGPATTKRLREIGILTLGQLLKLERSTMEGMFGKNGGMLWEFVNGLDSSPVVPMGMGEVIKSVGNSITTARDLVNTQDATAIIYTLAESVAKRLRSHRFMCRTVSIYVRDNGLESFGCQKKLGLPSNNSGEIATAALDLFEKHYDWIRPIRSLGVRGTDLLDEDGNVQLCFDDVYGTRGKMRALEEAIDTIRDRYGHFSLQRGMILTDTSAFGINPAANHTIHPISYHR